MYIIFCVPDFIAYTLVNLILKKISKIGVTRCQILRLKCTKIDFGWGSTPDPAGGAYSAHSDPKAVFKGPTFKGKEGEGEERRERGMEGRGERPYTPPVANSWLRHCFDDLSRNHFQINHHHRVASLGRSVASCPRLIILRHRSAGGVPGIFFSDCPAGTIIRPPGTVVPCGLIFLLLLLFFNARFPSSLGRSP